MSTEFYFTAAAIVTVLSAARLTRLAVADDFPPVKFFRDLAYDYLDKNAERRAWQIITYCAYCAAFWIVLPLVLWAWLSGVFRADLTDGAIDLPSYWTLAWWIFNGCFAASYLAAIVVRFDGDTEDGA